MTKANPGTKVLGSLVKKINASGVPVDWQLRLIVLFEYICKFYREGGWAYAQRSRRYSALSFCDEEVLCIYLWGIMGKRREVSDIYQDTADHLKEWFPDLPSYTAYIQRLNGLSDVFVPLIEAIQHQFPNPEAQSLVRLMDSFPVTLAHGKRSQTACVASELANKGYCASKGMYYYGVKVHLLGLRNPGHLPVPQAMGLSSASDHDLAVFRQLLPQLQGGEVYLDKAYLDELLKQTAQQEQQLTIFTPCKKAKGQAYVDAADQGLSVAVSRVRQPIESLFNWLEEKTGIQRASKVRSYRGLMVHVFGRLAAAMWLMLAEPQYS